MNTPDLNTASIIQLIDKLLEISTPTSIPIHHRWLDAAGVAAMLSVSTRTVREQFARRPDFPVPLKVGPPRWKASEIMEWAEHQRQHHCTRPRVRTRRKSVTSHQETAA